MHEFRADLHCHSTFSDGSLTPAELITLARARGLQGLSITDHDTVGSYPEALSLAADQGIQMVPGVEFSSTLDGVSVHILGYAFAWNHPSITELCTEQTQRRIQRNQGILDRLASLGYSLTYEDLLREGSFATIGRPHIALAMIRKGYVASLQEAFRLYLKDGGRAYVSGPRITSERAIEAIHAAGGLALIAHPHLMSNEGTVSRLLELPFDGIEAYYAQFSAAQCQRWLQIAAEKKWLVTGGSDFHGQHKPTIPMGASWTPKASFDVLLKRFLDQPCH